jgi:hypothetical protein
VNGERDRDRLLENALKHQLRQAGTAETSDACLDAETMAAWTDGGLGAHGAAMAEAHAANCTRCQALLGTAARALPAVGSTEAHGARLWRWWFAPLAATAAAVTLWMVVPQDRLTAPPAPTAVESARSEAAPAKPDAEVAAPPSAPAPPSLPAQSRAEVGRDRAGNSADRAESTAPKREPQSFEARERPAETAKPSDAAAEARVAAIAPPPPPPAPAPAPPPVSSPSAPAVALRKQLDPVADATARSSPSPRVIWLVGPGGAVHLATDGVTFMRLPFPEAVDLAAVTAADERRAVVTTTDGRAFETVDTGRTWQRRP